MNWSRAALVLVLWGTCSFYSVLLVTQAIGWVGGILVIAANLFIWLLTAKYSLRWVKRER